MADTATTEQYPEDYLGKYKFPNKLNYKSTDKDIRNALAFIFYCWNNNIKSKSNDDNQGKDNTNNYKDDYIDMTTDKEFIDNFQILSSCNISNSFNNILTSGGNLDFENESLDSYGIGISSNYTTNKKFNIISADIGIRKILNTFLSAYN